MMVPASKSLSEAAGLGVAESGTAVAGWQAMKKNRAKLPSKTGGTW